METGFLEDVKTASRLVRSRNYLQLGDCELVRSLPASLARQLGNPPNKVPPSVVGRSVVELFRNAVEDMKPPEEPIPIEHIELDTPEKRSYIYLSRYVIKGDSWEAVASTIGVARARFFAIGGDALRMLADQLLAYEMLCAEQDAPAKRRVIHNLKYINYQPYAEFIQRYDGEGSNYKDDIIIPELRDGRSWIVSIRGKPGVGKSSMAYAIARQCVEDVDRLGLPFTAVIWIVARPQEYEEGLDKIKLHSLPTSLDDVLNTIGTTLGNRAVLQHETPEKLEIVRREMRDHVCLLVLDNLDSEWLPPGVVPEIGRFMISLPQPHKVLVTMRQDQYWRGQHNIDLSPMTAEEARQYLEVTVRQRQLRPFTQTEFLRLYEGTHGNPFALGKAFGLVSVFGYNPEDAVDFEHHSPETLDYMFGKAYERLSSPAKKILHALPLFIDPASDEALEFATDIRGFEKAQAIGQLYRGHMIEKGREEDAAIRYTLLPFAKEFLRARRRESEEILGDVSLSRFIETAYSKLAGYYYSYLSHIQDRQSDTLSFFKEEKQTILSLMDWCYENDQDLLIKLLDRVGLPLNRLRRLEARIEWGRKVVAICKEQHRPMEADWYLIKHVAWSLARSGSPEKRREAERYLLAALERAEENNWPRNKALTLRNLGRLRAEAGEAELGRGYLEQSLKIWEEVGDEYWTSNTKHAIADLMIRNEEVEEARSIYEDCWKLYKKNDDLDGQIEVMTSLAWIHVLEHQCEQARNTSDHALELAETIAPPALPYALAARRRARVEEACGDITEAITWVKRARSTYRALGMSYDEQKMLSYLNELQRIGLEQSKGRDNQGTT